MTGSNKIGLSSGGETGMTDAQYKGLLLDKREIWKKYLELAIKAGDTDAQKEAEKEIALLEEKLKF